MKKILLTSAMVFGILFQEQQGKAEDVVCPALYAGNSITKQVGSFTFYAPTNTFTATSAEKIFTGAEITHFPVRTIECKYGQEYANTPIPKDVTCAFKDGTKVCNEHRVSACVVTCTAKKH
jgi:hypothetical protein